MPHSEKTMRFLEYLKKAQQRGFRTYLYFVATDNPTINISRVRNRVRIEAHYA
jgi:predicted ABC-type ATPase